MVRTLLCIITCTGTLLAQVTVKPTSIPVEATLHTLFPKTSGPCDLTPTKEYSNFRLSLHYSATAASKPRILLLDKYPLGLPPGNNRKVEIAFEHLGSSPARIRIWEEGKLTEKGRSLPNSTVSSGGIHIADKEKSNSILRMDRDFTAMVQFKTTQQGTLFAKAPATGKWVRDAKALFIRNGKLVYDIGWLGAMQGKSRVNKGKQHVAVLVFQRRRSASLPSTAPSKPRKSVSLNPILTDSFLKLGRLPPTLEEITKANYQRLDFGNVLSARQKSNNSPTAMKTPSTPRIITGNPHLAA